MSTPRPIIIGAALTVTQLAEVIGLDLSEVEAVLSAQGEPSGPDDIVAGHLAVEVGRALGVALAIEPRDLALEYLYSFETSGSPPEMEGRAGRLARAVLDDLDGLDSRIEEVSEHWSVSRMPVVDRNVLRIALHELEHHPSIPTAVVVSEAVRLASTYSTEKSASFVNGVLSALARIARGE
ncbi:MAG TPA: transcription antitermination factor NusB [Acidimicrobiia bacterium]